MSYIFYCRIPEHYFFPTKSEYLISIFTFLSGEEKTVLESANSGNLTFHHVTIEDAGNYLCETGNGIGDVLRKYARLYVHGKEGKIKIKYMTHYWKAFFIFRTMQ